VGALSAWNVAGLDGIAAERGCFSARSRLLAHFLHSCYATVSAGLIWDVSDAWHSDAHLLGPSFTAGWRLLHLYTASSRVSSAITWEHAWILTFLRYPCRYLPVYYACLAFMTPSRWRRKMCALCCLVRKRQTRVGLHLAGSGVADGAFTCLRCTNHPPARALPVDGLL